jgi:hypothetical protein
MSYSRFMKAHFLCVMSELDERHISRITKKRALRPTSKLQTINLSVFLHEIPKGIWKTNAKSAI